MNTKQNMKIIDSKLYFWRQNSKKIIFSNGCFDLLHKGHIDLLAKARSLGDVLIVGLNSDLSVKALKGDKRPIQNQKVRFNNLLKLNSVDFVIIFEEETPLMTNNSATVLALFSPNARLYSRVPLSSQ